MVSKPKILWEKLSTPKREEIFSAYQANIPIGLINEEGGFRISIAEKTQLKIKHDWLLQQLTL